MPGHRSFLLHYLAATVLALLPASPLAAQDAPRTRAVEVRLLAFEYQDKVRALQLHDPAAGEEGSSLEVELPRYLSETRHKLALRGDKLVFSTHADRAAAFKPGGAAATVTLPPKLRSILLVFLPAPAAGGEIYRIMALDDSVRGFPRGSIQTINMSTAPVRMMLEKKPFDIAPGKRRLIEDPPVRENNHTGVVVYARLDGEWRRVASSLWPHPGKKRVFQILYQDPLSGRMRLKGFRDIAFDDPQG